MIDAGGIDDRIPVLVLGLGNVLCGDDGVGVAATYLLNRRFLLAPGVLSLDGGTLGLALLPLVERADRVVILDAIRDDAPAGTLVRLTGDEVAPAVRERLSPHQIGVADLLAGAALVGRYPAEVVLLGVVPNTLELGNERTAAVAAALPALVEAAAAELTALGFPSQPRAAGTAPVEGDRAAVALGL
jgi:hydrogenase maturation protease